MAEASEENANMMNITVKTPKEQHTIQINPDAMVKDVSVFVALNNIHYYV